MMMHAYKKHVLFKISLESIVIWLSVGNQIWKSSDGEIYMMIIDKIIPTIALIPFNTQLLRQIVIFISWFTCVFSMRPSTELDNSQIISAMRSSYTCVYILF